MHCYSQHVDNERCFYPKAATGADLPMIGFAFFTVYIFNYL